MKTESSYPEQITHPDTGARMVLDQTQGSEAMRTRLERNIGIAQGGAEVLSKVREKERESGRIYVDPVTGYRARVKVDASGKVVSGDAGAPAESGRGAEETADDRQARAAKLRAELAELEK